MTKAKDKITVFFKSKTLWFFATLAVAAGFELATGDSLSTGASDQSAAIASAISVAGILLRFVTNSAIVSKE